jgi:acetyltransferase-like isoleucine patch superfamily enzyme
VREASGLPQGIQEAVTGGSRSALRRYQDLVVGDRGFWRLLLYEAVVLFSSWVPGALGLVLRKVTYPLLLGSVGRGVVFGQGVVLRHPHKIHLADHVIVDDLVVLDAKGDTNQGIHLGEGVFLGRGSILSCKNGDIVLRARTNLGFHCEVFSGSRVEVGEDGLLAAYAYVVGGGHEFESTEKAVLEQERTSHGVALGRSVWLGAGAKVLDGVRVGDLVVVGAGAVVTDDLPDGSVAVGVPARVVRVREAVRSEAPAGARP